MKNANGFDSKSSIASLQPTMESATIYRKDYKEPVYWIKHVMLDFRIGNGDKIVIASVLTVQRNTNYSPGSINNNNADLILDGNANVLRLTHISILHDANDDEKRILESGTEYVLSDEELCIKSKVFSSLWGNDITGTGTTTTAPMTTMRIRIVVELSSESLDKRELSGLYRRHGTIVTHCEPTGFRRIAYFLDRPDNTAVFDVRIEANKSRYPILLSNGNRIEAGDIIDDDDDDDDDDNQSSSSSQRHFVRYHDPHPKPCYIFALVAARNLARVNDTHTTGSGRHVDLHIYSEPENIPRLSFAMETLKKSMAWEEHTYGLEYDLNVYNIVAVQHFVLGAMENKGLNIFQTSLIATDPQCTTDITYDLVEKTIAHEYFHNWSGNRVTVRDWFEFALKEGLTVYRDQEFTSDVGLRTVTRIEAVKILREKQFHEDASEGRHAVRPEHADATREHELDALASSTTYHKGAEVSAFVCVFLFFFSSSSSSSSSSHFFLIHWLGS